jgi:hypothetical protein
MVASARITKGKVQYALDVDLVDGNREETWWVGDDIVESQALPPEVRSELLDATEFRFLQKIGAV